MTKEELDSIIAGVAAKLSAPVAADPIAEPAASAAPGWVTDAKRVISKNRKTKAASPTSTVTTRPTYTVTRDVYNTPGANSRPIEGFRIVKMFGDKPASYKPFGKFVTLDEFNAIRSFRG